MDFSLTREVVDQIIFAMEDQSVRRVVSARTGAVVRDASAGTAAAAERAAPHEEFVSMPSWQPADGFRLMEGFVGQATNPVYREMLRAALASGRGVFRRFKDVLKQSVDLERSWYRYKEQQIRAVVAEWYQSERELRGLLQLGPEPEERPEDVTAEFSVIVAAGEHLSQVRAIDRDALMEEEALTSADPDAYAAFRAQPLEQGAEQVLVAITAAEEVAAMVWARNTASGWELVQLAVRPPYRGLGLAERLLKELRGRARASGVDRITAQLDGGAVALSEYFGRRHFEPASIRMELAVQA